MNFSASLEALSRILKTSEAEAICLFGHWGTGKTYAWDQAIAKYVVGEGGFRKYSYVSLFGINDLRDLKKEIFFRSVELPVAQKVSSPSDQLNRATKKLSEVASRLPEIAKYSEAALPFLVDALHDHIVCLDDIERRGSSLSLRDVFGLATFLRDQRRCKVAVILNRDALPEDDRSEFERLVEKTFDVEIHFSPSPADCAGVAFAGSDDTTEALRADCITLGISNIRVLRRILRMAQMFDPTFAQFDVAVRNQALHGLPLFCWSRFEPDVAPTKEFIQSRSTFGRVEDDKTLQERFWGALLDRYRFNECDQFDRALMAAIHSGLLDNEELQYEAAELEKRLRATNARAAQVAAWSLFHDTFADNEKELVASFHAVVSEFAEHVTPPNLNGMVRILRKLGHDAVASDIINSFVEAHREDRKALDLDSYARRHEVDDPEFVSALKAAFSRTTLHQPLEPIIARLRGGSFHHKDLSTLANLTVADYVSIFQDNHGDNLSTLVETILQYPGDDRAAVTMKIAARKALAELARHSSLNSIRIERLGLDVSGA